MYLCNLKLKGKDLPDKIPEKIMNEVSSMVDIISFGIPDNAPQREPQRTNIPNFEVTSPSVQTPPQPQQSNLQALSSIQSQPTGYISAYPTQPLSNQITGYRNQGFTVQPTGLQTSTPSNLSVPSQFSQGALSPTGPLQSQPTGRPGQWGFVNAPAGSMAGIQALQQQLMPQPNRQGGFSSVGLQGTANVPWAVTKDEKT